MPSQGDRDQGGLQNPDFPSEGRLCPLGTCLKVRSAGPETVAAGPSRSPLSAGGSAGQALFSGLKIKASWPGPCWQREGGGDRAPGLKGIWRLKEASPSSTTGIAGSVRGPREPQAPRFSCHEGHRLGVSGCRRPRLPSPPSGHVRLSLTLSRSFQQHGATGGPQASPNTLFPPPADSANDNSHVPTTPAGKALLTLDK